MNALHMMATDEEKEPIVINYHDIQPLYYHDVLRYNDAGGDSSYTVDPLKVWLILTSP